jgi:hypothetical protein
MIFGHSSKAFERLTRAGSNRLASKPSTYSIMRILSVITAHSAIRLPPSAAFGQPLSGITNQLPARSLQFTLRLLY